MVSAEELLSDLIGQIEANNRFYRLENYHPYPFQMAFHFRAGVDRPGEAAKYPGMIAANKIGKSECAGFEMAMHATGLYPWWWDDPWNAPDWWLEYGLSNKTIDGELCRGRRIEGPNHGTVAGTSNDQTRDVPQSILFGPAMIEENWGTGTVPQHCIGKITKKQGIPNAFDTVRVRHHGRDGKPDGWSQIAFKSYEQDKAKLMGGHTKWAWLDEEPPGEIHAQIMRSTFVTKAPVMSTFTPENGATALVNRYMQETPVAACLVTAGWDDAAHFQDPKFREEVEAQIPAHELKMRTEGIPLMGSGLVYPFQTDDLAIQPFELPRHFPRIAAIDWGQDHKAAVVVMAFNVETDEEYVYKAEAKSNLTLSEFANLVKRSVGKSNQWIPVVWPHDVNKRDARSGETLRNLFVEEGVNMMTTHFTNPPGPGKGEGQGGNSVEAGLIALRDKMGMDQFKVFATCEDWFREQQIYHRKDGKVVSQLDDLMDATRYASMMRRHAALPPTPQRLFTKRRSRGSNWG